MPQKEETPEVKEIKPVVKKRQKWSRFFGDSGEKEYFVDNLSMLLSSGMDILSALDAIKEGVRSKLMKGLIDDLKSDIDDGLPLWKALKKTKLLSLHILSLFRIGEESGKLAENLKVINTQQQKERIFKSKIHSAMMYPILVLSLTLVVGIGIAWFILPRLSVVFAQLKLDLPLITKALIGLGNFLGEYGYIAIPLFLFVLFGFFYIIFIAKKTKWIGQWLLFHFPVIKTVIQQIELSRFGYVLGNLLDAGIPIVEALHSLTEATSFRTYKKFYTHLQDCIEEGNSFQKSFDLYPGIKSLMPATVQQMVSSGEQSGNLSHMLEKIGITFEEKTDTSTKNLAVLLEPILLLIVWGGVVMVALAVILPIYSLIGGLNNPGGTTPVSNTTKSEPDTPTTPQTSIEENIVIPPVVQNKDPMVEILPTGIGYLNVRRNPSDVVIGTVEPRQQYIYIEDQSGWYHIRFDGNKEGWILGKYVTPLFDEQN